MADKKISQLTSATTPLAGTEELPIVQGGNTVKVSVNNLTAGKAVTASQLTVENNSASDAVRITQTGAGNALVVEDSTTPDGSPFLINASGVAVTGSTTALTTQTGTARIQSTAISAFAGVVQGATATNAATIDLSRCRGTFGAPTIVSSGDSTGRISFGGHDGVAYIEAAKIEAAVDGTPGTNDMPGRLVFSTTADGASTPTERVRIDNAGNVGVGTTSPGAKLNVVDSSSNDAVRITQTGAGNALVVEDSANPDATPFVVRNNGQVLARQAADYSISGGDFAFQASSTGGANGNSGYAGYNWANNGIANGISMFKSRGNSLGTQGVVSSGDTLSVFRAYGSDGTAFIEAASITAAVDGTPGTNDMPGRLVFSTTADGASTPTERMRIDSSGNVGIGTSAPNAAARLDVSSTTSGFLPPRMTTAQRDLIATPPNGLMLYNSTTDKLQVRAAGVWVDLH